MKQAPLDDYHAKRHFDRTPEPPGRVAAPRKRRAFFIQRHAATRLHYDFRLELDGVLKSWAVPKGPSLDPSINRLAVHVEDHPLEYGTFEGTIPKGEYGAGTVVLWDRGEWTPEGDPREGYRRGKLVFTVRGRKLQGRWSLVRIETPSEPKKENWLLRKLADRHSRPQSEIDIVTARPESVLTGPPAPPAGGSLRPSEEPGAVQARSPGFVEPELATLVTDPPEGDEWLHEIKFDGYRFLAYVHDRTARLFTRNGIEWTAALPGLAGDLGALPAREAILDGELVALASDGTSDFQALKEALSRKAEDELVYYAFDLIHLDGYDLRAVPLHRRKDLLFRLLGPSGGNSRIRYSDHVLGRGKVFFRHSCDLALEGIVSKRKDSPYRSGRGRDWLKSKCHRRQEFVIGGFTDPGGARRGFGALLLGLHEKGGLVYAGRVGTGFDDAALVELRRRFDSLERSDSPFASTMSRAETRGVHWIEPTLVAEVSYSGWTRDRRLRHPVYVGLREDKPAVEVVSERAKAPPEPIRLTHPDRVLYPEVGITKRDLARFYSEIAPWILPHVTGRLLSLVRCPEGHTKPCFYQKHRGLHLSKAIRTMEIEESEGPRSALYIDDEAGLLALVQMGVLEIHPWGSRVEDLERPDRCVFDLDPDPGVSWAAIIRAAHDLRAGLRRRGLESFVKTTGGKGLHVVVPLVPSLDWHGVKAFSKGVAEDFAHREPDRFTAKLAKAARKGRIFIDYLRNGRGATAVAAYSTRARAGAPVSVPVAWDEVTPSLRPDRYTVLNLGRRLARLEADPWKGIADLRQSLPVGKS